MFWSVKTNNNRLLTIYRALGSYMCNLTKSCSCEDVVVAIPMYYHTLPYHSKSFWNTLSTLPELLHFGMLYIKYKHVQHFTLTASYANLDSMKLLV